MRETSGGWCHQDDDIGCSWIRSPSQEDQQTTIHEQETTEKNRRTWWWAPAAPQRLGQTALEGKEKPLHADHTAPPPGWAVPGRKVSLELLVPPVEKRGVGEGTAKPHSIVDCFMGAPILVLPHRDCRGTCRAQPLGIWLECRMRSLRRGESRIMRSQNYIILYFMKKKSKITNINTKSGVKMSICLEWHKKSQ